MNINLFSKNIQITPELREYALTRVTKLEKLLENMGGNDAINVQLEISRSTRHHRAGEVFHADCSVKIAGKHFYAESDGEDLTSTIDEVKEKLYLEINKNKDREQTLMKRGAASIKKMLKGLSKRNPFTSKY